MNNDDKKIDVYEKDKQQNDINNLYNDINPEIKEDIKPDVKPDIKPDIKPEINKITILNSITENCLSWILLFIAMYILSSNFVKGIITFFFI